MGTHYKIQKMKTTILLFALIIGCIIPTYSQINIHRKTDASNEPFLGKENKKNDDFGNYKFADKFSDAWRDKALDSFTMSPLRPAPRKFTEKRYSGYDMPCYHPKSGDDIPCLKPKGTFPMRVFKPKDVIWGILW